MTRLEHLYSAILMLLPLAVVARLTLLVRQRSQGEFAELDVLALTQISLVIVTFIMVLTAPSLGRITRRLMGASVGAVFLYYLVALCSAVWSAVPLYTLYRAGEFLVLGSAVALSLYYVKSAAQLERRALTIACVIVLLGVGMHVKLGGLSLAALHTNNYSVVAGMIFCYCLMEYLSCPPTANLRRKLLRRAGLFGLFFLAVGTSAASNISVLGGVAVIALVNKNRSLLFLSLILLVAGFSFLSLEGFMEIVMPGKSIATVGTMAGRDWLWELYVAEIQKSPWIGHGFAASTRVLRAFTTNTHNGYLAVMLGTGFLGLVAIGIFLIRVWREGLVLRKAPRHLGLGASIAVLVGLVNNLSISILGEQWTTAGMGLLIFLVLQVRHVEFERCRRARSAVHRER